MKYTFKIIAILAVTTRVFAAEDEKTAMEMLKFKSEGHYIQSLSFDPREFNPRIVAAVGEGLEGSRPSKLLDRVGALAGINGGFYRTSDPANWIQKYSMRYAQNFMDGGLELFPTAILKTEHGLLGDSTTKDLPAIGWSRDGSRVALGNLSVQWWLKDVRTGREYEIVRETEWNHKERKKFLYVNGRRFEIERKIVVAASHLSGIDRNLINSFRVKDDQEQSLLNLKVDDKAEIFYRWVEDKTWSNDSKGFGGLDYVISGGDFLVEAGEVLTNFDERNKPDDYRERVGICVHETGTWEYVVNRYGNPLVAFARDMKERGCFYAINMDGGWSSTMHFSKEKKTFGKDRLVSDAIAVMPQRDASFKEDPIFDLIRTFDAQAIYRYIQENPSAAFALNENKQSARQVLQNVILDDELEGRIHELLEMGEI